jgi:hypothetical protein
VAIYTGAKALSRWPINDESTLTISHSTRKYPQNQENGDSQAHKARSTVLSASLNRLALRATDPSRSGR